jgi:hypothetical protein
MAPPTPQGVEMGGALKNVLAIACGISDGLKFGSNARAAIITRGACGGGEGFVLMVDVFSVFAD